MNRTLTLCVAALSSSAICSNALSSTSISTQQATPDDTSKRSRPSVLFINIDDLNDWTSVLGGHPTVRTPNLTRLAKRGVTFTRAICASPVCFPSRTAVLTGIHPTRSGAISNFNWGRSWRFYVGDATTIPKAFESAGWSTAGAGKNFHGGNRPEFQRYFAQPREPRAVKGTGHSAGPIGWGVASIPAERMPDRLVVDWASERIRDTQGPLFLAVGIYKPHVRWVLPQSSFDRYPLDQFETPATLTDDHSDLAARLRLLARNEAKFGPGFHARLQREGQDKAWARAYAAAVTFADEQLGRLLDAWESSAHARDGIVILWSDHGFMLGEKQGWGKFKPWFDAIHANLIVSGPGVARGATCAKAVSLIDLFPTLIQWTDIPAPSQTLSGRSLMPLLSRPDREWDHPVVMAHEEDGVRYDVVLDNRFRMTRLITGETELYDLDADPHEWHNLADDADRAETVERMASFVTFRVPTPSGMGWLEAESVPCQTSADFKKRGNFHYPRHNADASGESYLVAELRKGRNSYIDFVWNAEQPGDYEVAARLGPVKASMNLTVRCGEVVADAAQATSSYAMPAVGAESHQLAKHANGFSTVTFGHARVSRAGKQILRTQSLDDRAHVLRIDRLRITPPKRD